MTRNDRAWPLVRVGTGHWSTAPFPGSLYDSSAPFAWQVGIRASATQSERGLRRVSPCRRSVVTDSDRPITAEPSSSALVTGGGGALGRAIALRLAIDGHPVRWWMSLPWLHRKRRHSSDGDCKAIDLVCDVRNVEEINSVSTVPRTSSGRSRFW